MNGTDLLAEFRATRSEASFSELVRRFTNLVYSIAKRRVTDVTLAQEITQIVFIRLANAPPKLDKEAQLLGWLHRTTVHVSIDLWRSETRRRAREQHAVAMQNDRTEEIAWSEMTPVLDEALDRLEEADRQTLLLRFFHQKSMADLGRDFGISEDAAKMRVSRALERLRRQLGAHGTTCSAALLATLLFARSVEIAPAALAPLLMTIKIAAPAGLAAGFASLLFHLSRAKLAAGIAALLLLGGTVLLVLLATRPKVTRVTGTEGAPGLPSQNIDSNKQGQVASNVEADTLAAADAPDPAKLLQGIIRARRRIVSGMADFDVITLGSATGADETNRIRLSIRFEDGRYWAESTGREYRYVTPIPGGPEADEIIKRADRMTREQAVRQNLLQPFPSHHVTFYDSQAITDYWETASAYPRTVINKPGQSSVMIFDPRCLGICTFLYVELQVDSCLAYKEAKSLVLVGKELVEGAPAWHIQMLTKTDFATDIWVDALQHTRVLKIQANGNVSTSRYSQTDLKDPLPLKVINEICGNNGLHYLVLVTRQPTRYDVPIDPISWTLDGLHMKVGTEVIDSRISRLLGYWTGTGLSELPRREGTQSTSSSRAQLEAVLETDPASLSLRDAQWIILNSPDGPAVQKAADVILQQYIRKPDLVELAQELERMRPSSSSNLLRAMLNQNPSADVRGNACLALATLLKDASQYGTNRQAAAEAMGLYSRVIGEFGQVKQAGHSLAELAQPQLNELRRLTIGKEAPDIEGYDLQDHYMKLRDYRGKVVVLVFWSALCLSENDAREYQRLVQQMEKKPFVLLGIHADNNNEKARALAEKYEMTWPSFKDAREGPISKNYNINSWPTIYVLDRHGAIRFRGLYHGSEIAAAVDKLLKS